MNLQSIYTPDQVETYFNRVNFTQTPSSSLETLSALHRLHQRHIPFENLDVLQHNAISIEPDDVFDKLVTRKRGGYCFEQNKLFSNILREIGFNVTPFIARVRWKAPDDVVTALSHMVLKVEVDSTAYLCDVGFGGVGLIEPIRFDGTEPQSNPELHRLIDRDSLKVHQIGVSDEWRDVYLFEPKTVAPIDLEIGNWFSHTHPKAHFRNVLLVARLSETGRVVITDTEYFERSWTGDVERNEIQNMEELRRLLESQFSLPLKDDVEFKLSLFDR